VFWLLNAIADGLVHMQQVALLAYRLLPHHTPKDFPAGVYIPMLWLVPADDLAFFHPPTTATNEVAPDGQASLVAAHAARLETEYFFILSQAGGIRRSQM